ncbi:cytidine deaminase 1-like [Vigna unguiculata]|uniref:cytidine deaminase n=1 Tax=Vigna unguiculata TaxID=3917 RepID=A0A4D6L9S7_VIGUN|nr:cytidine deaminase 1-like [Vigna unguiculata]QCD85186.1 cytidine deaminase [Vigna unguiculata]
MDQPPKFLIEASEALAMAESAAVTLPDLLPRLVPAAQSLARPPISNFQVAAVGLGPSGRIFVGVNLEFPGLPLHHAVHAEQFLVSNLSLNAEANLTSFAVSAAPCGHCRQFLQELRAASDVNIMITSHETPQFTPLSHFLPHQFGPHDLLSSSTPLLLETHHNALTLLPNHTVDDDDALCNGHFHNHKLKNAALEAANKSHAPYTASPSGVALLDRHGNIYKGSYLESAAFNPSLGPVQAALVAFVAAGGGDYHDIVDAVLVEKEDAAVKQEQTARLLLHSISPDCNFSTFLCHSQPSPP